MLRVRLLKLDEEEHLLLLTMHHIVSDGWSMEVFVRELTTLYTPSAESSFALSGVAAAVRRLRALAARVVER
jgi:NRPS condensation-like uncharacterized protein